MITFAYITAPNMEEAKVLAQSIVKEKLAACVNILPNMTSVYAWDGDIQVDEEVSMIVKTDIRLKKELSDFVIKNHSYDCPCIIFIPLDQVNGNPEYLKWLKDYLK